LSVELHDRNVECGGLHRGKCVQFLESWGKDPLPFREPAIIEKARFMRIAVIGSINTDLTIKVPHFSKRNETVVGTGDYTVSQGGKGANQAAAAAAAGAMVHMIGKVGSDDFGIRAVESLTSIGVNCDHVTRTPGHATGLATILVDDAGDNSITVAPGANAQLSAIDIRAAETVIAQSQIVMLQLEIPIETVNEAARLASENGALVLLDPAPAPSRPLNFLDYVDYLTPNEIEAEALAGLSTASPAGPEKIADYLLNLGVKNVALTLGERGCFIANKTSKEHLSPNKVTAIDSTGAGDVFSGYLAASLAQGMTFREASKMASAAAALSVTQPGARTNLPNRQQVEEFMSRETSAVSRAQ
jgi:ribokinase